MKLVAQGAKAKIFEEGSQIIKERFIKKYRLSELDASLRKLRTRKEAKIIQVLQNSGFASPKLIDVSDKEIKLIDFGLSFVSDKIEDKAVDLHLLDRTLESKHFQVYPACFDSVIQGYSKDNPQAEAVLKRLEIVRARGRNKK